MWITLGGARRKRLGLGDVLVIPWRESSRSLDDWLSRGTAGAVGDRPSIG